MKKNGLTNTIIMSAVMLLAVGFLGGCTGDSTNTISASVPKTSDPVEEESRTDEEKPTVEITADSYDALNEFSYELFAENMDEKNPVLSPLSAYIALSMAGIGAENNTKEEFASALGDVSSMTAICDNVMTTIPTSSENNIVTMANSAWIDDGFAVYDSWLDNIDNAMHSEVFQAELSSFDTTDRMNAWIADKTNGLIDKMIEEPLDGYAKLVLFNTVYFKAKWESGFESYSVYEDQFYPEDESELTVEMMHKEEDIDYLSNEFAEGIILPYKRDTENDGNFAFVALKPVDENRKVRDMYNGLTQSVIKELLESKQTEMVNTKLPKFEISFDRILNDSLIDMGIKDAFDAEKADFSGIWKKDLTASDNNLYIDLVRQKAKIIVDEEGTEAAAATAVFMECGAAMMEEEPRQVFFDKPFVYIIMDMDNEIPLFIGILDSPLS